MGQQIMSWGLQVYRSWSGGVGQQFVVLGGLWVSISWSGGGGVRSKVDCTSEDISLPRTSHVVGNKKRACSKLSLYIKMIGFRQLYLTVSLIFL